MPYYHYHHNKCIEWINTSVFLATPPYLPSYQKYQITCSSAIRPCATVSLLLYMLCPCKMPPLDSPPEKALYLSLRFRWTITSFRKKFKNIAPKIPMHSHGPVCLFTRLYCNYLFAYCFHQTNKGLRAETVTLFNCISST